MEYKCVVEVFQVEWFQFSNRNTFCCLSPHSSYKSKYKTDGGGLVLGVGGGGLIVVKAMTTKVLYTDAQQYWGHSGYER